MGQDIALAALDRIDEDRAADLRRRVERRLEGGRVILDAIANGAEGPHGEYARHLSVRACEYQRREDHRLHVVTPATS